MSLLSRSNEQLLRRIILSILVVGMTGAPAAWSGQSPTSQISPGATQPLPPAAPPQSPEVDGNVLAVPPVVDRPIAVDEGPKIRVSHFVLTGASDHPNEALAVRDLQKLLDDAVAAQPAEGYTVNQMQQIAGRIAVAYRTKGYVLAQAFVPAQDVHAGDIKVQVIEGKLGFVRVEGNRHYRTGTLEAAFDSVRGQTVNQNDVEARLLRLSDYPGLGVFGVFTPGKNVGESDLVLKVQREKLVEFALAGDNYGNPFSGEYRGDLGVTLNSPLGIGDRLRAFVLKARSSSSDTSGADTKYYSADYRVPFAAGRAALTAGYTSNDYAVGGALSGLISGRSKVGDLMLEVETTRSRLGRTYMFLEGDSKKADLFSAGSQTERLKDGVLGFALDRTDSSGHGRWLASVSALHGTNSENGLSTIRSVSDTSYTIERLDIERVQRLTEFQTLRMKVDGQLTSNALPTLEQTSLGGPSSVRAYEVATYVGDKSALATAEWYVGAPGFASLPGPGGHPWGQTLQFVLFYDFARGWLNKGLPGETSQRDLKGWGGGIVFNVPRRFYLRVDASKAISPTGQEQRQPNFKNTRIYASAGINF